MPVALGYVAFAFVYGYAKAYLLNGKSVEHSTAERVYWAAREEVEFRYAIERLALPALGVNTDTARLITSSAFALSHAAGTPREVLPFRILDAFAGGYLYSRAYDAGGLATAIATHFAHNVGVVAGSRLPQGVTA